MKAMSHVLLQAQRPVMLLGLPPALAALSLAGGLAAGVLTIKALSVAFGAPVTIVVTLALWLWFMQRVRQDHHYDRMLLVAPIFWRARSHRTLIAGRK